MLRPDAAVNIQSILISILFLSFACKSFNIINWTVFSSFLFDKFRLNAEKSVDTVHWTEKKNINETSTQRQRKTKTERMKEKKP